MHKEIERCTAKFVDGEIDVAQIPAQEPFFYNSGQVHTKGPLNAYWALGESLGPDTFVRKSHMDYQYL